jgi:molecular chaperone DnaK (HSP70)
VLLFNIFVFIRQKIAQSVNQDEAAVMGAGFRAAGISTQFRVREISIKDSLLDEPIEVTYEMDPKGSKRMLLEDSNLFDP